MLGPTGRIWVRLPLTSHKPGLSAPGTAQRLGSRGHRAECAGPGAGGEAPLRPTWDTNRNLRVHACSPAVLGLPFRLGQAVHEQGAQRTGFILVWRAPHASGGEKRERRDVWLLRPRPRDGNHGDACVPRPHRVLSKRSRGARRVELKPSHPRLQWL